jgi:hypothetical protein
MCKLVSLNVWTGISGLLNLLSEFQELKDERSRAV